MIDVLLLFILLLFILLILIFIILFLLINGLINLIIFFINIFIYIKNFYKHNYICKKCFKTFKTKGWLTRHNKYYICKEFEIYYTYKIILFDILFN